MKKEEFIEAAWELLKIRMDTGREMKPEEYTPVQRLALAYLGDNFSDVELRELYAEAYKRHMNKVA